MNEKRKAELTRSRALSCRGRPHPGKNPRGRAAPVDDAKNAEALLQEHTAPRTANSKADELRMVTLLRVDRSRCGGRRPLVVLLYIV